MSKIKQYLFEMAMTMAITFVVAAGVTYLYSFLVHSAGAVNWETAFDLALIFGIVLPLVKRVERKGTLAPQ